MEYNEASKQAALYAPLAAIVESGGVQSEAAKAGNKMLKNAAKEPKNVLAELGRNILKTANEEGFEEVVQTGIEDTTMGIVGEDVSFEPKNYANSYIGGAVAGGLMGAPFHINEAKTARAEAKARQYVNTLASELGISAAEVRSAVADGSIYDMASIATVTKQLADSAQTEGTKQQILKAGEALASMERNTATNSMQGEPASSAAQGGTVLQETTGQQSWQEAKPVLIDYLINGTGKPSRNQIQRLVKDQGALDEIENRTGIDFSGINSHEAVRQLEALNYRQRQKYGIEHAQAETQLIQPSETLSTENSAAEIAKDLRGESHIPLYKVVQTAAAGGNITPKQAGNIVRSKEARRAFESITG